MNIKSFTQALSVSGFEIVHAFPLDVLSESCRNTFDSSASCGILVGNTRTAWHPFLLWLNQQPDWKTITNPFNDFSEHIIQTQSKHTFTNAHILWTHETESYIIPAQKIAHESGLAFRSAGQFNIHPQFGAWFALRALVLLCESSPKKTQVHNPSSDDIEKQAFKIFQNLYENLQNNTDIKTMQYHWEEWLALRDLYEIGKEYRYTEAQIQYHYTHNKQILNSEIELLNSRVQ